MKIIKFSKLSKSDINKWLKKAVALVFSFLILGGDRIDEKPSKQDIVQWLKKVMLCTFSVMLLGFSTAICVKANYGTNSIAVFFKGVSKSTGLNLGLTTNIINTTLMIAAFFVNKKYINIGTVIYATVMGCFINWGLNIYNFIGIPNTIFCRSIMAAFGCGLFFLALGMFVAVGVGVNPWVAFSLIFRDKFNKSFGMMKMAIDLTALSVGWLLGGVVGPVTVVAAFLCGPCVQRISAFFEKIFKKIVEFKFKKEIVLSDLVE